jgi:hypothetical protein
MVKIIIPIKMLIDKNVTQHRNTSLNDTSVIVGNQINVKLRDLSWSKL